MAKNKRVRKNKMLRRGIRTKIAIGLFLVFLVCGILATRFLKHNVEHKFYQDITKDMSQIWQNANTYSTQLMIAKHYNNDSEGFLKICDALQYSIRVEKMSRIKAYDIYGRYLRNDDNDEEETKIYKQSDITKMLSDARNGNASYIVYNNDNKCSVRFIFPVMVAEKMVGILSIDHDYSALLVENRTLVSITIRIMIIAFTAIFIITQILLSRWINPIVGLSNYSQQLTDAISKMPEKDLPLPRENIVGRSDEIGLLAKDYVNVSHTIENQFNRIMELIEDKQVFFNNVTHELKTPLTTIMGYTQLITQDTTEDKELLEMGMTHIQSESQRLYQLVLQLLEFAKVQTKKELFPVKLSEVMMSVISSMQLKAGKDNREFIVENSSSEKIMGDDKEIAQVYINLIDNAIKYGFSGTPISLGISVTEDTVNSTVTNIGKAVPKEEYNSIFEPFYRIDKTFSREQGSSGLGLSICKKIMEGHNGTISVTSDETGKNTFCISFPRMRQ